MLRCSDGKVLRLDAQCWIDCRSWLCKIQWSWNEAFLHILLMGKICIGWTNVFMPLCISSTVQVSSLHEPLTASTFTMVRVLGISLAKVQAMSKIMAKLWDYVHVCCMVRSIAFAGSLWVCLPLSLCRDANLQNRRPETLYIRLKVIAPLCSVMPGSQYFFLAWARVTVPIRCCQRWPPSFSGATTIPACWLEQSVLPPCIVITVLTRGYRAGSFPFTEAHVHSEMRTFAFVHQNVCTWEHTLECTYKWSPPSWGTVSSCSTYFYVQNSGNSTSSGVIAGVVTLCISLLTSCTVAHMATSEFSWQFTSFFVAMRKVKDATLVEINEVALSLRKHFAKKVRFI